MERELRKGFWHNLEETEGVGRKGHVIAIIHHPKIRVRRKWQAEEGAPLTVCYPDLTTIERL
jgi:hypothetical protein